MSIIARNVLLIVGIIICAFAAGDDPVVDTSQLDHFPRSHTVAVEVHESGGHLGFVSRRNDLGDRRWLDWRIVPWIRGVAF